MSNQFERELRVALEAVREAARLCVAVQEQVTPEVLAKKDRSPVTVADFGSQALICARLAEQFPADPVIAEEDSGALRESDQTSLLNKVVHEVGLIKATANEESVCRWIDHGSATEYSSRFWTLDPIDGTKGFLRGEQYAVSLGLVVDGEIQVGVLGCPNLPFNSDDRKSGGTAFFAIKDQGAFTIGLADSAEHQPIRVSEIKDPARCRFCESVESGHSSHGHSQQVATELGIEAAPVRLDSQAKYAVVARGEADVYMRLPTRPGYREKIWDHAAGVLVILEAGGMVSDITGKPLDFTKGRQLVDNRGVLASNGVLHDRLLESIGKLEFPE